MFVRLLAEVNIALHNFLFAHAKMHDAHAQSELVYEVRRTYVS